MEKIQAYTIRGMKAGYVSLFPGCGYVGKCKTIKFEESEIVE
jgi:hypothetical protein